jgi:hypothetical protein
LERFSLADCCTLPSPLKLFGMMAQGSGGVKLAEGSPPSANRHLPFGAEKPRLISFVQQVA